MTLLEQWTPLLTGSMRQVFSPSGHALLLHSPMRQPFQQVFEIHFAQERDSIIVENDEPVTPLVWASDNEVVYRTWGQPLGKASHALLWVFSLDTREKRLLSESKDAMSMVYSGTPGHLSVLTEPKGKPGLYDMDISTGVLERLPAFDSALEQLEVYPLFRHAYYPQRQEVVLTAWKIGDYLQDVVHIRPDRAHITQRELTEQARRKAPFRLFLLDTSGKCQEIPGTYNAHHPCWSPDGTLLSYSRYEADYKTGSVSGEWIMRRANLELIRLGGCGPMENKIMHPSGVMLTKLEYDCLADKPDRVGGTIDRWVSFRLQDGAVMPE